MGLFSSSKKVYVSSVAYNLGGPEGDRPDYLQTVVLNATLSGSPSLADDITSSLLHGPGMDQLSFYRWAKTGYPLGQTTGRVTQQRSVNRSTVAAAIPKAAGETVKVETAVIGMGDIKIFADRYILANQPARYEDVWKADYDAVTKELVIDFATGTDVRSGLSGFFNQSKYIYAYYVLTKVDLTKRSLVYIYRIGTGNPSLDALDVSVQLRPEVFPVIPLRLENKAIDHPTYSADFSEHSTAFRRATGEKIETILSAIDDNPDVADIDHAFLVHGVELNSGVVEGREYLYRFFHSLMTLQRTTPVQLANWIAGSSGYTSYSAALRAWRSAQTNPAHPLYGTPQPTSLDRVELETSRFEFKTVSALRYETHVGWVTIDESVGSGQGWSGAKKGNVRLFLDPDITIAGVPFEVNDPGGAVLDGALTKMRIVWQVESNAFKTLTIYGAFHENFVYDGKTVEISAREALTDPNSSGFVVPLHYPSLKAMSLVSSNQLVISSRLIVFNSYEVVKQRWYESSIFRVLIVVVMAAVMAVVFPAGFGILGTNLAVGSALGLSGTTALIAGAVANATAAMVLTMIITSGSQAIFGDEVGTVIGAVVSLVAMNAASSFMTTGSMPTMNWGSMMQAENLMKISDVLSQGVEAWARQEQVQIGEQAQEDLEEYQKMSSDIEKKMQDLLGYGGAILDPLSLLQASNGIAVGSTESSDAFVSRTLLTGADIAEISVRMIEDFSDISLQLATPMR